MVEQNALLTWGPVLQVRRNHALEHATLNLLAAGNPHQSFAGHSDSKGFWIVGNISTDMLLETVQRALERMKAGESWLAIHANCGTNYAASGLIAGSLAWLATLGASNNFKKTMRRLPLLVLVITGALIATQSLGPRLQASVTTCENPGLLRVKQIVRYERTGPMLHRVLTTEETQVAES